MRNNVITSSDGLPDETPSSETAWADNGGSNGAENQSEPVVADVVPPPPSPLRFGLRGLMALMVICSLQFAVMNWFGVLWGLVLSFAMCLAAFSLVFVVAMTAVRGNSAWLERLDQIGIRLVVAMAVLIISSVFAGGGTLAVQQLARFRLARQIETDLGLRTKQISIWSTAQSGLINGLQIERVEGGGVADRTGLRQGDILLLPRTVDEFYLLLDEKRGSDVDVNVTQGADVQPLENCKQWSVTLAVPE